LAEAAAFLALARRASPVIVSIEPIIRFATVGAKLLGAADWRECLDDVRSAGLFEDGTADTLEVTPAGCS
jgi:hypothetical protein